MHEWFPLVVRRLANELTGVLDGRSELDGKAWRCGLNVYAMYGMILASSPGHSQVFNVARCNIVRAILKSWVGPRYEANSLS